MKNAEYCQETGCPQRDSAEHEEYAGAQSTGTREVGERDGARLLEAILSRGNLNNAYKRVRANGGAPGIDGMTVEEIRPAALVLNGHVKHSHHNAGCEQGPAE